MSGSRPVHLVVDVERLGELRDEITKLIDALSAMGHRPCVTGWSMGSEDVADAVRRFADRWQHGREDILGQLRGCRQYVELAIEAYLTNERTLASALDPTTDPVGKART